jgi:hypothetical protein
MCVCVCVCICVRVWTKDKCNTLSNECAKALGVTLASQLNKPPSVCESVEWGGTFVPLFRVAHSTSDHRAGGLRVHSGKVAKTNQKTNQQQHTRHLANTDRFVAPVSHESEQVVLQIRAHTFDAPVNMGRLAVTEKAW